MVLKFIHIFIYLLPAATAFVLYKMYRCWRTKSQRDCSSLLIMFIILSLISIYVFWHFFHDFDRTSKQRNETAMDASIPIKIALVWDNATDGFLQGAELAVKKVNQSGGIAIKDTEGQLNKRQLSLVPYINKNENDHSSIAFDQSIMAVVGYHHDQHIITGSLFYSQANLLFIAPLATDPLLSSYGSQSIIQTMPDQQSQINHIVDFAIDKGLYNLLMLKPKNQDVTTLKPIHYDLLDRINKPDAHLNVLTRSYDHKATDFQEFVIDINTLEFDAIFVLGPVSQMAKVIKQIRRQGLVQPILGLNHLDSQKLFETANRYTDDVYVVSVYSEQKNTFKGDYFDGHFVDDFLQATGNKPNYMAAKAYESIYLLAQVWAKNQVINTELNSATLRAQTDWEGLYGTLDFNETGQVINHPLLILKSNNQQFTLEQ